MWLACQRLKRHTSFARVSSVFFRLAKADMKHLMAEDMKQLSNITTHEESKQAWKT